MVILFVFFYHFGSPDVVTHVSNDSNYFGLVVTNMSNSQLQKAKITVWNVGQGSCTTVEIPENPLLLVDFGSSKNPPEQKSNWKRNLTNDLLTIAQAAKKLQVIISHSDKDHLNLAKSLFSELDNLQSNGHEIEYMITFGGKKDSYTKGFQSAN